VGGGTVCLYFSKGSWMAALLVMMGLSPLLAWARETQCKRTPWVVSYCSVGEERGCLVKAMVFLVVMYGCESWTVKKTELQRIDAFELWCWRRLLRRFTLPSSLIPSAFSLLVEPTVTVYPAKTQPLQHHNLLVCSVNGFYLGHVEVRWFWKGQEEEAGVISTDLIQNGDWTFQTVVMLETVPQSGEVYTCQLDHPSWRSPIAVEWSEKPSSDSAQSKMMSGTGGFALGLLFLVVGLFTHFRNQKGHSGLQPTGNAL
uniref:Ig-like domain-containing protein n=1 Tax=Bos mutus grunniens TaxID=30521 RepID=A0A8B9Y0G4_BOSMU